MIDSSGVDAAFARVALVVAVGAGMVTVGSLFAPWWTVAGSSRSTVGLLRSASVLGIIEGGQKFAIALMLVAVPVLVAVAVVGLTAGRGAVVAASSTAMAVLTVAATLWMVVDVPGDPLWGAWLSCGASLLAVAAAAVWWSLDRRGGDGVHSRRQHHTI